MNDLVEKVIKVGRNMVGDRLAAGEMAALTSNATPLIAIVSRSALSLDKTRKRPLFRSLLDKCEFRGFLETGGSPRMPGNEAEMGSIYMAKGSALFDHVILDESIRLTFSAWSRAFYAHLFQLVRPGGTLILPLWHGAAERTFGRWTKDQMGSFFNTRVTALKNTDFVQIERGEHLPNPSPSVAGWFMDNAAEILLQQVLISSVEDDIRTDFEAIFALGDATALEGKGVSGYRPRLDDFTKQHCYFLGGISYKHPLLSHIIHEQVETKEPLRIIDMGGGYGLLAAELALDPTLEIKEAVCADISNVNGMLAARLYADMAEHLAGRLRFICKPAQELEFDGQYDVVSYVGSLLYVPKELLEEVVERAWQAVAPGGVLVVHENIKHKSFKADFDIMFTVGELDGLLEKYGDITRYASQYTQMLTKAQTGEKTVFRVVKKSV